MPDVHALLVGINAYVAVTPLLGCVEDIRAIEALFRARIPGDSLKLRVLHDGEATRAAIIDGFRSHLAQAREGDFALFYFCGHGSQEECPAEWQRLEPSGLNQTIVPVDARTGDVFDLADKELNTLLHEVAGHGARIVTIFDSCHSGGVTRDIDDDFPSVHGAGVARMTPARRDRRRTLDDYLPETRTLYDPARIAEFGAPEVRHIALAACQPFETAKEFPRDPPRRGAFSLSFEESLRSLGPTATYADLVNAIRTKVRGRAADQLPNLFVAAGGSASERFLGGEAGRRDLVIAADAAGSWWLSSGALDGMPPGGGDEVTEVAIHERDAFDTGSATPSRIADAIVDLVESDRSRLVIRRGRERLSVGRQYLGTIVRLGARAPLVVTFASALPSALADAIRARCAGRGFHFTLAERPGSGPSMCITLTGEHLQLAHEGRPVAGLDFAGDATGVGALLRACEHLGRWHATRDRTALGSTLNDVVQLELVAAREGEKIVPDDRAALLASPAGAVLLQYAGELAPRVQFRIRNRSSERLFVVLLDLTNVFSCTRLFADWIPPGGTGFVSGGKVFRLKIPSWPDERAPMGSDDFKLFVALEEFDAERWNLPDLVGPDVPPATRLVVDDEEDDVTPASSWGTSRLHVEVRRAGSADAR